MGLRIKKILREKPKILVIMASIIRQNYSERCEALINKQINMEFHASYVYMAMGYYFERDDVALLGFAKFFKKASGEEREHGTRFLETHYLDEQVKAVKELSDLLTKMKRAGEGVGIHIIDKELEEKSRITYDKHNM